MPDARSRILFLDNDVLLARALRRSLAKIAEVVPVDTCAEASFLLDEPRPWLGFICDVALRDGSGLDWLAAARKADRREPALILTSSCRKAFVNRAFSLRASYLCKPFERDALRAFVVDIAVREAEAETESRVRAREIGEFAWRLQMDYRLTPSETEVVMAAVRGASRQELVEARGVTLNTLKTQLRLALRKLGADSIADVRLRLGRSQIPLEGTED
jgi:DNA-binding NarL/FixJ family response regulator